MKIIISPAKKFSKILPSDKSIDFYNETKTIELYNLLLSFKDDYKKVYKCSDAIASDVTKYFSVFGKETYLAKDLYAGMVFQQLDQDNWTKDNINYYCENVIILDALYGMIKPTDYISKYRLDFLANTGRNLYKEWDVKINDDLIINLASDEYNKMINEKMFNVVFVQIKNNKEVMQSTECKKMRGVFLNWMVVNNINNTDDLIKFNLNNYTGTYIDNGIKFVKNN